MCNNPSLSHPPFFFLHIYPHTNKTHTIIQHKPHTIINQYHTPPYINHKQHNSFFQVLIHLIVRAAKAAVTDPVNNVHAVRCSCSADFISTYIQ